MVSTASVFTYPKAQEPAGSPTTGLTPTLGFFSYDNGPDANGNHNNTRWRLAWLSISLELIFGFDPAVNADALFDFGRVRAPNSISQMPGPFPTPTTLEFFPIFVFSTDDQQALGNLWPGPSGLPGGTFGVLPNLGASISLPTLGTTLTSFFGLPLGIQCGTSAMAGPTGPLLWGPGADAPSNSLILGIVN